MTVTSRPQAGSSPLTRGKLDTVARESDREGLIPAHAGKTTRSACPALLGPAHPRSRGENHPSTSLACTGRGSSPLTRGKPEREHLAEARRRLIPAHAGKTGCVMRPSRRPSAHPRSRGENLRLYGLGALNEGSSPLTRGKLCVLVAVVEGGRLIPAHAGKTVLYSLVIPFSRAHPRSRGENPTGCPARLQSRGSSPLTRGKPDGREAGAARGGLIPAHAGKTGYPHLLLALIGAHPRSRGENHYEYAKPETVKGSSPLTRGKPSGPGSACRPWGLIPAHAGKTLRLRACPEPTRAHPRSRGENSVRSWMSRHESGSSPLTRGKRFVFGVDGDADGLIPAHAGKTTHRCGPRTSVRAHPRSRGENSSQAFVPLDGEGSSPLTRGKRNKGVTFGLENGLIPAHAGKTA